MPQSLRINFVLPFMEKTGGVLVVLEHARQLEKLGHTVRVIYPLVSYSSLFFAVPAWKRPYARLRYALRVWRSRRNPAPWFPGHSEVTLVPAITDRHMPPGDVVIATTWPTAYSVSALPAASGRKFYFIQHYETWTGNIPAIDASFKLGLRLITIAPWLTDLMRQKFGQHVVAEVHNGIDLEHFSPPSVKAADPVTVLMMYHVSEYKGIPDGLKVLRRIRDTFPQVRIQLFGQYESGDDLRDYEYELNPSPARLVELYRSAHIFLSPSLTEGWHLPPMEAMACGCAVVATNVGCIPVLSEAGNMVVTDPGDTDALYAGLAALLSHPELRDEIAQKGLETIRRYTWPEKTAQLERVLIERPSVKTG